jgi:hypothetical protein
MSVNFPLRGCTSVRAMRYADSSHEMIVKEPNSAAIVAERVDVSVWNYQYASYQQRIIVTHPLRPRMRLVR